MRIATNWGLVLFFQKCWKTAFTFVFSKQRLLLTKILGFTVIFHLKKNTTKTISQHLASLAFKTQILRSQICKTCNFSTIFSSIGFSQSELPCFIPIARKK